MTLKQITGKRNRKNGMSFEYKVLARVKRERPVILMHASGSRGLFDILMQTRKGYWKGILCRVNGYITPTERNRLYDYMVFSPDVHIELYYKESERKISKMRLTI